MSSSEVFSEVFEDEGLYFVPLSGSEQFGANLNLYVSDGDFLAVDFGIGFADERLPGIDILLPDPALLEKNKDRLKAIIITHAHEDHIGAMAHFWDRFNCPVYAGEFTAAVLRKKLEGKHSASPRLRVIEPLQEVQIGSFKVQFIPVSHSIPGSFSLMIRTKWGNLVHSGDWNLDPNPVAGLKTKAKNFQSLGDENILAYIGDSTNAGVNGYSGSEADVAKGLIEEFKKCTGRIAVTIFSSNIGRMISIAEAARKTGRHVTVVGRSLHRMVEAAQECGYLDDIHDFVPDDEIGYFPDDKTVIMVTGSQGEYRSALARIARGDKRSLSLTKGDTVIFSARAIPGNERNINNVKNNLIAAGVRVVDPRNTDNIIHVSGHPCRSEIEQMLKWLRPSCIIPVHGERLQLEAQADLAKISRIKQVIVPSNGSVIRLSSDQVEIVDHVETRLLALDQDKLIPADDSSIIARRKLQYSGVVHISLALNKDLEIISDIKIDLAGLRDDNDGEDDGEQSLSDDISQEIREIISDIASEDDKIKDWSNEEIIAEELRICIRRYIYNKIRIKPKTTVHVMII